MLLVVVVGVEHSRFVEPMLDDTSLCQHHSIHQIVLPLRLGLLRMMRTRAVRMMMMMVVEEVHWP